MNRQAMSRDRVLTTLAVLMGLMAMSNLGKPIAQTMSPESSAGFVFFGSRLHGVANAIIGPLFGCLLAAYAYGVWTMRRWVLPIALAYAAYVPVNLVLFALDPPPGSGGAVFGAIYAIVAIGVTGGGAWYLYKHRDQLR
jgi:hypothetical protein